METMNTITIEHADSSTTDLLKQLSDKLGLNFKAKKEKFQEGVVTNPEILKAIEDYESGKAELITVNSIEELKELLLNEKAQEKPYNAAWVETMKKSERDEKEGKLKSIKLEDLSSIF